MKLQFVLFILLVCFSALGEAKTITKVMELSKKKCWWPLGKYVFTTVPRVRARLLTEGKVGLTEKIELPLYVYNVENWQKALKAPNCTNRLEVNNGEYKIYVPLNASWSDWVTIQLPSKILYLVPSDCYGYYYPHTSNFATLFELDGGTAEAIPESELSQINSTAASTMAPSAATSTLPPETPTPTIIVQTKPQQVSSSDTSGEVKFEKATDSTQNQNVVTQKSFSGDIGVDFQHITALIILVVSLMLLQGCFGSLTQREFIFGFIILIFSVVGQILFHGLLILEAYFPSPSIFWLARLVNSVTDFLFLLHVIMILLNWPPGSFLHIVINSTLLGLADGFILFGLDIFTELILRCFIALQNIVVFFVGRAISSNDNSKPILLSLITFIHGAAFACFYAAIYIGFSASAEFMYDILSCEALFQACVMSMTLLISGCLTRKASA